MKKTRKTGEPINRREMVKRTAAGVGVAIVLPDPGEAAAKTPTFFTGLAADYDKYDGLGLAALIAKKQITSLELLNAVRQRVEALNPKLNAFCDLFFDKAEAQIKAGPGNGAFKGVPFALKDIGVHLAGVKTTSGSRVFKNYTPNFDSTLVERYKKAGLLIFGRTTSPEFGLTTTTESALFGQTRNPWDLERTSGGSSGGTSAAVAARILPAAHGSDGGGSIRIPASCCGLFGFKPTRGRVPMGPTQFESWNGCSHHHVLTISVRDSAALLDATAGDELGSPFLSTKPARPFLKEVGATTGKLRIALAIEPTTGSPVDPECRQATLDAAKLCEGLGHHVEEARLPIEDSIMRGAFLTIIRVSMARTLEDAAKVLGRAVTDQDVEPITWLIAQAGKQISSVEYSRAIATMHQTGLAMAKFMQRFDVILSPTLAKLPVKLGVLSLSRNDVQGYSKDVGEFGPHTALYNVTGQPSMSVPLHWTKDDLPVGVMFSGRFGQDDLLFRLAAQIEKAKPWAGRKPKV
ncbi:MAG: amidase [Acidobacteriota bacterium]|nr:amidase [Acidobacteriota bacterium]